MYSNFTTVYPYAAFALPLVGVAAFLLLSFIMMQRVKTDSFHNILGGVAAALIFPMLFVGTLTAAFLSMNDNLSAEHYVTGTVVDGGPSGNLTLGEGDYIQESALIFIEAADSQEMLPLEVTTGNIQHAVGETATFRCDIPAGKDDVAIPCTVAAMH